jgi:zinicin-like metallopeptidase
MLQDQSLTTNDQRPFPMRLSDFESMIRRLSQEVPASFFEGVAEVAVSPRTVAHPSRPEIYTLGECIPIPAGEGTASHEGQSRIVLYHGSFLALSKIQEGFDWREEAWETLTHELRHHLEWRARAPQLENFDWAVEQNFARQDGEPFDPAFYLEGEPLAPDQYRVDEDVFLDRLVDDLPSELDVEWAGLAYRVRIPSGATLPCFVGLRGVDNPPAGELILVLRRKAGVLDLFRSAKVFATEARARPSR